MLIIKKYAYQKLFETLNSYLHISSDYGSPPIFYWYCKMIDETRNIDSYSNLRKGEFKFQLGNSLGIAHVRCDYVGKTRVLIITDYEINTRVLFFWKSNTQKGGIFTNPITSKPRRSYRRLTTKPLFGYSFVMNDRKEYNLIDKKGNLVTQWFSAIKPFQQPYGKYQIIAYINVNGQFCALGYDGKVYSLGKSWQEMYTENREILTTELFMNIITEQIDNTMKTKKKVVRLTEADLRKIIGEAVNEVVTQGKWGDGEWEEWNPHRTSYDEYCDLDNMEICGIEPKIERTKTKRTYFDNECAKNLPDDEVLEKELYSLDDVPFDILQKLCNAYEKISVGGAPGTNGRAIAWQRFWRDKLQDALNRRKG